MTIEERITNEFNSNFDDLSNPIKESIVDDIKSLVIKCCKEQQEIDIQRAEEWLKGVFLEQYLNTTCSGGYETHVFDDKFFSEFKQAMKGE